MHVYLPSVRNKATEMLIDDINNKKVEYWALMDVGNEYFVVVSKHRSFLHLG